LHKMEWDDDSRASDLSIADHAEFDVRLHHSIAFLARSMMSLGALRIAVTYFCSSAAGVGSTSILIRSASRRKSSSLTNLSNAPCSAARRSAGTRGGVISARPIADWTE